MSVSANIFLIIFGVVFLVLVVMAIIHVFHAWRFGEHTPLAAITSGVFFFGMLMIIGTVWTLLNDVDWNQSFDISLPFVTDAPIDGITP